MSAVEVKDVELPESMQRAMARQAEAGRETRARIIHAEGEFQAALRLANAAQVISRKEEERIERDTFRSKPVARTACCRGPRKALASEEV